MLKFICLFLSVAISLTANANQCDDSNSCVLSGDAPVVNTSSSNQPKEVIVHKIKKDIYPLPTCNDEALIKAVKNYVDEFYGKEKQSNVLARRREYFIKNNLVSFSKENVAFYKKQDKRPVSDIIINLKVNHGVIEENMLLCKNNSKNIEASRLYILVYPYEQKYKVQVINLTPQDDIDRENVFIYEM